MTKCNVRFNPDYTKWYCLERDGNTCPIENRFCNLTGCKGRKLTEEEDNERLLELESRIKPVDTPKRQTESIDTLIKRLKKELFKIEEEEKEKLNKKRCEYKLDQNGKWFCKKNMDTALSMDYKECYRDDCNGRKLTLDEEKEENLILINIKNEIRSLQRKEKESNLQPTITEESLTEEPIIEESLIEEPKSLKKCEWHLCTNTIEIGGKKERFCCSKCQKKDSRLRWRRRTALRNKGISSKTS